MTGAGKRIALLVVATIVAGGASGVLLVRAFDGAGDAGGDDDLAGQFADTGERATAVVDALTDERNRTTIDLTGTGDLVTGTGPERTATLATLTQTLTMAATTGGLDEPDEITQVAALQDRFVTDAETIRAIDRSPYREMVEESFPEQLTADVTSTVDAALAGEPIDLQQILALIDVPIDQSYLGLADRAHAEARRHAERLDDDRSAADPDDLLWLAGAVLTGFVAVVALAGIFVTASRRTPPVGPAASWPPPPPAA